MYDIYDTYIYIYIYIYIKVLRKGNVGIQYYLYHLFMKFISKVIIT